MTIIKRGSTDALQTAQTLLQAGVARMSGNGKSILSEIRRLVVEAQTAECVTAHRHCPDCGQPRLSKGHHDLPLRTVFGKVTVANPRLRHCDCRPHMRRN